MPSAYAHYKFGKMVIPGLPKDIKNVIKIPLRLRQGYRDLIFYFITGLFRKTKLIR